MTRHQACAQFSARGLALKGWLLAGSIPALAAAARSSGLPSLDRFLRRDVEADFVGFDMIHAVQS